MINLTAQDKEPDNGKKDQGSRNKKRIWIFAGLSAISIILILIFTTNNQTFQAIGNIRPQFLLLTFGAWIFAIMADSYGMIFFVYGTGEKIKIGDGFQLSVLRIFFNLLTPFSAGGQPFTVFALTKLGVSSGKGSSIILTRLISFNLCSFVGAMYAFFFFGHQVSDIPQLRWPFLITAVLVIVLSALAVIGLMLPRFLIFIINGISIPLARLHIIKDRVAFKHAVIRQAIYARSSFKNYFGKQAGWLLCGILACAAMYISQVTMMFFILHGLGINIPYIKGFASCALLLFLFSFMPTPGASGLGDIIFVIIFAGAGAVPRYLLGITVILWRTFYQYLSAILGAIFSARFLSGVRLKKTGSASP